MSTFKRANTRPKVIIEKDAAGTDQVKKLAEKLKKEGKRYVDNKFPANDDSLWKYPNKKGSFLAAYEIEWKRPNEFSTGAWSVFSEGISDEDIVQGAIGDCYFLAALASISRIPELIDNLIVDEYAEQGVYGVKFYTMGEWKTVIIDDLFPCIKSEDQTHYIPLFAHSPNFSEIWMMLAEKAWAKLNGCYQVIANGMVPDMLCYLTGGYSEVFFLSHDECWRKYVSGILWKTIYGKFQKSSEDAGVFLSASGIQDEEDLEIGGIAEHKDEGLKGDHAYGITDMKEFKDLQLIQVRNPWGSYEWKGDYSDQDKVHWTKELKDACGFVEADDGSFWMSFHDFCDYFTFFGCCTTFGSDWKTEREVVEWKAGISAGGRDDDLYKFNPTFLLKNTNSKVVIQVEQDDIRDNAPYEMFFFDIFLNVITKKENKKFPDVIDTVEGYQSSELKAMGDSKFPFRMHSCERVRSLEMELPPGEYYVVLTKFHCGFEGRCAISVFSPGPFELDQSELPKPTNEEKAKMGKRVINEGAPKCCMTGKVIELENPSSYKVKKGVFWDITKSEKNFRCGSCRKPFTIENSVFDIGCEDGKLWKGYCQNCFKTLFYPKCVVCKVSIYNTVECNKCNGEFVRVPEGRVHELCWIEYQLMHSKSNLVCPIRIRHQDVKLKEGYAAAVVRIPMNSEKLGHVQSVLDKY